MGDSTNLSVYRSETSVLMAEYLEERNRTKVDEVQEQEQKRIRNLEIADKFRLDFFAANGMPAREEPSILLKRNKLKGIQDRKRFSFNSGLYADGEIDQEDQESQCVGGLSIRSSMREIQSSNM